MRKIKINETQYSAFLNEPFNKKQHIDEMLAYHGSKADFDRFSLAYMGTGTGAQEFGYGLYFTFDAEAAFGYGGVVYEVDLPEIQNNNYIFYDRPVPRDKAEAIYQQLLEVNKMECPEDFEDEQSCNEFIQELREVMPPTEGRYIMYNIGKYVYDKGQVPMIMRNCGIVGFIYNNGKVENAVIFSSRDIQIINKYNG